jgi:hypothetical protein|nr:MAG TPA: protein of unknown function (DUF4373) [Caudoviricetes sp.]
MCNNKLFLKHDICARRDSKLLKLQGELGHRGKGIYWDILEYLAEYMHDQGTPWVEFNPKTIAVAIGARSPKEVHRVITDFDLFIFDSEDGNPVLGCVFSSRRMKEEFGGIVKSKSPREVSEEISRVRREAGLKGGTRSKGGGRPRKEASFIEEKTSKKQANDTEKTSKNKQTEENKQAKTSKKQANDTEKTSKMGGRGDKSPKDLKTERCEEDIAPSGVGDGFSNSEQGESGEGENEAKTIPLKETYQEAYRRIGATDADYGPEGLATSGTLLPVVSVYEEVRKEYPDLPPSPDYDPNMFYQAKELMDSWGSGPQFRERLRKALVKACSSAFLRSKKSNLYKYMWLTKLSNLEKIEAGNYDDDCSRPKQTKAQPYSNQEWAEKKTKPLDTEMQQLLEEVNRKD